VLLPTQVRTCIAHAFLSASSPIGHFRAGASALPCIDGPVPDVARMSVLLRPPQSELRYAWLGDAYVDFTANQLHLRGREVRLTPKSAGVLRELALRQNRVVKRDDLLGLVWRDGFPTDDVLTHAIKELRRALDDDPRAPQLIETIPRVGYRLRASVRVVPAPEDVGIVLDDGRAANEADGDATIEAPRADHSAPDTEVAVPESPPRATGVPAASSPHAAEAERAMTPPGVNGRHRSMSTLLTLFALAVLAWFGWRTPGDQTAGDASTAVTASVSDLPRIDPPMALTSELGSEYFPAISPDGNMVAFVRAAEGEVDAALMLKGRDPAAQAVVLVPVRAGRFMIHLNWSPDGSRILYADVAGRDCMFRSVPASGGAAQAVVPCDPGVLDGFDWLPDGARLIGSAPRDGASGARGIATVTLATGEIVPLDYGPRAPDDVDLYPRVSPDGKWIVFRRGARPFSDLWIMPSDGGDARLLTRLGSRVRGVAWEPDSEAVIVSSDHAGPQALYRVALDDGKPRPLGIENAHYPSVARRADQAAFHTEFELSQMIAFELDAEGRASQGRLVAPASRSDAAAALSPSGRRVAFISERGGASQLWVHDFESGESIALSNDPHSNPESPQWSPDETSLLYTERVRDRSRLLSVDVATGRTRALTSADERVRFGHLSPDGAWIYYSSDRSGAWQIWRMRPDGGEARQLSRDGGLDPRTFEGDPHVYFSNLALSGVFRLDPETGHEEPVTALSAFLNGGSYTIAGDELWIYRKANSSNADAEIIARPRDAGLAGDAAIRHVTRIAFPNAFPTPALGSFDRARRRIVTTMVTRDGTDVFVTRLPD
jgi:Tol biopolymer transport system component/DNA-binding winged helix-turn-helix (wHTH) protein